MTQSQLDHEVAAALGEDVREIRRRGFSLVAPFDVDFDPEPNDLSPQMIDWDQYDANRFVPMVPQPARNLKAA